MVSGSSRFSIFPSWTAAARPELAALRSMLESDTVLDSQSRRSLSTPMTAMSSGTLRFSIWQAWRTSRPALSLQARIPQGLGSFSSHVAIFLTADHLS